MKVHPAFVAIAIFLAVVLAVSSSPFALRNNQVTGGAVTKTGAEVSWWERLFQAAAQDSSAVPAEGQTPPAQEADDAQETDPYSDENAGRGLQYNDNLQMYGDSSEPTTGNECSCDSSVSEGCSTSVSDRVSDLNDRVTDLENQQTSSSCSGVPSFSGCTVKIIDADIMLTNPPEPYTCDDYCGNGQPPDVSCVFSMVTQTKYKYDSAGKADVSTAWSQLSNCDEGRYWNDKFYTNNGDGSHTEKRVFCMCCAS